MRFTHLNIKKSFVALAVMAATTSSMASEELLQKIDKPQTTAEQDRVAGLSFAAVVYSEYLTEISRWAMKVVYYKAWNKPASEVWPQYVTGDFKDIEVVEDILHMLTPAQEADMMARIKRMLEQRTPGQPDYYDGGILITSDSFTWLKTNLSTISLPMMHDLKQHRQRDFLKLNTIAKVIGGDTWRHWKTTADNAERGDDHRRLAATPLYDALSPYSSIVDTQWPVVSFGKSNAPVERPQVEYELNPFGQDTIDHLFPDKYDLDSVDYYGVRGERTPDWTEPTYGKIDEASYKLTKSQEKARDYYFALELVKFNQDKANHPYRTWGTDNAKKIYSSLFNSTYAIVGEPYQAYLLTQKAMRVMSAATVVWIRGGTLAGRYDMRAIAESFTAAVSNDRNIQLLATTAARRTELQLAVKLLGAAIVANGMATTMLISEANKGVLAETRSTLALTPGIVWDEFKKKFQTYSSMGASLGAVGLLGYVISDNRKAKDFLPWVPLGFMVSDGVGGANDMVAAFRTVNKSHVQGSAAWRAALLSNPSFIAGSFKLANASTIAANHVMKSVTRGQLALPPGIPQTIGTVSGGVSFVLSVMSLGTDLKRPK